jgi:OOP family OmpA-OmpF porin
MNRVVRAGVALGLAALALPALADDETRPYLYSGAQYTFRDDARNSSSGIGYTFGGGAALNQFWGFEIGGFSDQFDSAPGRPLEWTTYGIELGAQFFYTRDPAGMPFVELLAGGIRNDLEAPGIDRSIDPMAAAGIGFIKMFGIGTTSDLGLRADLRYRWTRASDIPGTDDFGEPQVRVGLVVALGPKPGAAAMVAGADADKDGVGDETDLCPGTPAGTAVNSRGCPIGGDSDGDGVADDVDRCPGTSAGATVDKSGCPTGVQPGGPAGDKPSSAKAGSKPVDTPAAGAEGESTANGRKFDDVHFEFDRSNVGAAGASLLDGAASTIGGLVRNNAKVKVELSGHTDWVGTEAYNQALSERRANAVKEYLVRKGIDARRIRTSAYGETRPIATNETPEGRAQNRRTEVRTTGE